MRLIDADALKKRMLDLNADVRDLYNSSKTNAEKMLCGQEILGIHESFLLVTDAPTIDAVDRKTYDAVCKQHMWERDVAIEQLKEIGKSLGEKMDDVAKVVRCKDCKYWIEDGDACALYFDKYSKVSYNWHADDFCSYGERRNDG